MKIPNEANIYANKQKQHISCTTDVGVSDSVANTMRTIHNTYSEVSGCIPTPDIIVNSAGRFPKASLTTTLSVSSNISKSISKIKI